MQNELKHQVGVLNVQKCKKNMGTHPSFYGSSPFSKINNHLLELGHEAIDW